MLSCGLAFLLWRHEFMAIFSQDPGVQRIGAVLLIFAAAYQLCDALYIIYYGGLRGAGDTLIPALVTAGLCWGMLVGGGAAVVWYLPHWGVIGPWAIAGAYGVILGAFMVLRFHRGRWRGIHLEQAGPPPASNAAALSATVPDLQLTAGQ
jgi:Na+-driven multidrug efflux pump